MINDLIKRYPVLTVCENEILNAVNTIISCYENGGKLLLCGNGGSCADCDHIVGELMKGFLNQRPVSDTKKKMMLERCEQLNDELLSKLQSGLPAISLPSITALNTAYCNDVDSELVYAQSLFSLAKENDVLVAVSTSGNSKNVLAAAKVAMGLGVKVITLTGASGGKLKDFADVSICVPSEETYKIQELHLPVYHYICAEVESHFFEK